MPEIDIDPETGLPRLEAGLFWRVTKGRFQGVEDKVEVRKRVRWGFSVRMYGPFHINNTLWMLATKQQVFDTAVSLYREATAPTEVVFGDFPPRKLGDSA